MNPDKGLVNVRRMIPDEEKLTVWSYVSRRFPLEGHTFQIENGKIYTVKEQGVDFITGLYIITTKGARINVEDSLEDKEANLSDIIRNEDKRI